MRSPKVYAASFKCPVRIYYGAQETHFALSSQPTAKLARDHNVDVQAIAVDGGHVSALEAEIKLAIDFFRQSSFRQDLTYILAGANKAKSGAAKIHTPLTLAR